MKIYTKEELEHWKMDDEYPSVQMLIYSDIFRIRLKALADKLKKSSFCYEVDMIIMNAIQEEMDNLRNFIQNVKNRY